MLKRIAELEERQADQKAELQRLRSTQAQPAHSEASLQPASPSNSPPVSPWDWSRDFVEDSLSLDLFPAGNTTRQADQAAANAPSPQ